jgi:hypothetical protein
MGNSNASLWKQVNKKTGFQAEGDVQKQQQEQFAQTIQKLWNQCEFAFLFWRLSLLFDPLSRLLSLYAFVGFDMKHIGSVDFRFRSIPLLFSNCSFCSFLLLEKI